MTLKYTVTCILLVFLGVSACGNAFGQVDYQKLEPDWCKPHSSFQTAFAISNYETADIPVSYNKSLSLTGWRSFFNHSVNTDSIPTTQEIWNHYHKCFDKYTDSLLFEGPTLYCARICRDGQRAFVCLQSVNEGRNYFFTLFELDRVSTDISAELLTKALQETGRFVIPAKTIDNPRAMSEMVRAFNSNSTLVHIAFQAANPAEANKSIPNAKAFYDALSKNGLKAGKANYTQLPLDFPTNSGFGCGNALVEDRVLLYVR